MSKKRMINPDITSSDAFLSMPLSTQALYLHLNLEADDDGFVDNAHSVVRKISASVDDLKLLVIKRFLLVFDDTGVMVIKHWRMHNTIQKDRYKATNYQEELSQLFVKNNKAYTLKNSEKNACIQNGYKMDTNCIQNGNTDKIRLDKNRLDNNIYVEFSEEKHDASLDILENRLQTSLYDNVTSDKNDSSRANLYVGSKNDSLQANLYVDDKNDSLQTDLYAGNKNDSSRADLYVKSNGVKKSSLQSDLQDKAIEVLEYLNLKANRSFQNKKNSLKDIIARLKEKYTVEDCKKVIDLKVAKWSNDEKMKSYLVPSTLFRGSNFERYVEEVEYEQKQNNTNYSFMDDLPF